MAGEDAIKRSKKLYFIRALKQDALAKLKHPEFSASDLSNPRQKILSLERLNLKSLRKCLESVPEHRKRPSRLNPLPGLLALLLAGVLCGNTVSAQKVGAIPVLLRSLKYFCKVFQGATAGRNCSF